MHVSMYLNGYSLHPTSRYSVVARRTFTGETIMAAERPLWVQPVWKRVDLLKIYLYGYLNRIQSSRRLERETQRNIELMWLTGRLMPDFKTIADFRCDTV